MTPSIPPVRFLRVMGIRSRQPTVLASVGRYFVRWHLAGWDCDCPADDGDTCSHVETVASHLDPRVLGTESRR